MRDILARSVVAHDFIDDQQNSKTADRLPPIKKSSRLADFLHILNITAGMVAAQFEEKRPTNEYDSYKPSFKHNLTRLSLHRATGRRIRTGSRIIFEKSKEAATTTKHHLKTPLGKVATVNMLALIALLIYVQSLPHQNIAQATRDAGTALEKSTLQQYLPVIGNNAPSTAFNEASVTQATKHLPLYVWVTPWNTTQVATNKSKYSSFSAFWASVGTNGSSITPKSDFSDWSAFQTSDVGIAPTWLTIDGDPNNTYLTLTSPSAQQAFISQSLTLLKQYNFGGLDIDFEGLGSENQIAFTSFTRNLATALHAENKQLAVTLEARIANQVPMDWHSIGQLADEVRIMSYDYHSANTSLPGPIAPLGWVKEVVDYAVQNIDPSKIVVGLGNYGYDWQAPVSNASSWTGTGISFEKAQSLSQANGSPIIQASGIDARGYDIGTAPNFSYTDANNVQHQVWFEDASSLQKKVDLLNQYPLKGIIFWSVGIGDQSFMTNHK